MFDLPAQLDGAPADDGPDVSAALQAAADGFLAEIDKRNRRWFDQKTGSVEAWAADRAAMLKLQVAEAEQAVADKKKAARLAPTIPEQVRLQGEVRKLQAALESAEDEYRVARAEVARERDKVLDEAAYRLRQAVKTEAVFRIAWRVV